MTRINSGISPIDLLDEHLIAEWRELPRIVNELEKHPERFNPAKIPHKFTLNTGHVLFFRDKLLFLARRHRAIRKEMRRRKINFNHKIKVNLHYLTPYLKQYACNDWTPTRDANLDIVDRIIDRWDLRKKAYHYTMLNGYKHPVDDEYSFSSYLKEQLEKYYETE